MKFTFNVLCVGNRNTHISRWQQRLDGLSGFWAGIPGNRHAHCPAPLPGTTQPRPRTFCCIGRCRLWMPATAAVIKRLCVIDGLRPPRNRSARAANGTGAARGGKPARCAWPVERSARIKKSDQIGLELVLFCLFFGAARAAARRPLERDSPKHSDFN